MSILLRRLWARMRGDRRANVALIFGLSAVPLFGAVGLAVDYGGATAAKSRLDTALDAAALLATTYVSNATASGVSNATGQAQTSALARFAAQTGTIPSLSVTSTTASVTATGGVFTAQMTYNASFTTAFGGLFGFPTIALKGSASSSLATNPYANISVLMDVSSSMTIAATTADIALMNTLTTAFKPVGVLPGNVTLGEGCAFACHWSSTGQDYYALAKAKGVTLRLDVLRGAVGNLITTMAGLNSNNLFKLGLYTFNYAAAQVYAPSTNIMGATGSLANIAPDINDCSANCPESYFASAMASMGTTIGQSGDGSTAATPRKYLFVITDGLVDQYTGSARVIDPIDPTNCTALKAKGVTVMVLYTPYLPLPTNAFYNTYVAPVASQIAPQLQACASSASLYFQASDATGINAALQQMLKVATTSPGHFTQ